MKNESVPQNKKELKEFILKTMAEASGRFVPIISEDERKELHKLHGQELYENDYNSSSCERL